MMARMFPARAAVLEAPPTPTQAAAHPRPSAAESALRGARLDWIALALVALAFGLRAWRLGDKSLWLDEGISVAFSLDGPPRLFQLLIEQDIHPPLYYVVLHYWLGLGGPTETSVRFPSLLIGTLLVACLYRFVREIYPGTAGRLSALLATVLAAFSPFLIYYSQEARMYGALSLAGLAATIGLWRAAGAEGRAGLRAWAAYTPMLAAAPYLHHFGWMVVALHGAFVVLAARRLGRRVFYWLGALAVVVLSYLPWAPVLIRQVVRLRESPDFWQGTLSLWFVVQHAFAAFTVGFGGAFERYLPILVAFTIAFLVGAVAIAWRGLLTGRAGDLLVVLYLVVPLAVLYAIVARNPKFADRYLIVVVPAFLVLLARGVVGLGELAVAIRRRAKLPGAAMGVVTLALAVGLVAASAREGLRVYDDEAYAKEDYRAAVDHLIRNWQPGDAVLLMLNTWQLFDYYSHGLIGPTYGLGPTDDLPSAAGFLNAVAAQGHRRLWVLMWNPDWADRTGAIRDLMDESAERLDAGTSGFYLLPLRLYSLANRPTFDADPRPARPLDATFGGAVRLTGTTLAQGAPVPAGGRARVRLYWQAERPIAEDLAIALRLRRGGEEWARFDGRPAAHTYPTTYWRPGRPVRGSIDLGVPAGTPPGRYEVELVVYDAATRQPLAVRRADASANEAHLTIGSVDIARPAAPPPVSALPVTPITTVDLGGVEAIGASFTPDSVAAGTTFQLALAMRGSAQPEQLSGRGLALGLIDASGRLWPLSDGDPVAGQYPFASWTAGEVVVDRRSFVVPAGAAAGPARVVAAVREPSAAWEPSTVQPLGTVQVSSRPRQTSPPKPARAIDGQFGGLARLVGFDGSLEARRGESLRVVLAWHVLDGTTTSYWRFLHLADAENRPLAQRDGVPGEGTLPTTSWVAGEYLADDVGLAIPADLAPGTYRLVVGLFDPATGARLPVVRGGERQPGDSLLLGEVVVR